MQPVSNVLSVGLSDLVSTRNAALRRAGFRVVSAASLQETGEACESELFDVSHWADTLSERKDAADTSHQDGLSPAGRSHHWWSGPELPGGRLRQI